MRARASAMWLSMGVVVMAAWPAVSSAQEPWQDTAVLQGWLFSSAHGNVAVNAAAGTNNQQANVAVVATGNTAFGAAALIQILEPGSGAGDRLLSAEISDGAFANSSGLIAVNVAAGADNQQGNVAVISLAGNGGVLSDIILSQTRTSPPSTDSTDVTPTSDNHTLLAPGAFENSSGIVQVSIIGGERNASSNLFALSVQGGANN